MQVANCLVLQLKFTSLLRGILNFTLCASDTILSFQLRYCEPVIRRSVPLALGLIYVSNPKLSILDTLSKFSHDSDSEVAHNSIFAMGLVGAGTNNARYLFSTTFYKAKVKTVLQVLNYCIPFTSFIPDLSLICYGTTFYYESWISLNHGQ
jgi:hypothetical protein